MTTIFHSALELEGVERRAFLNSACAGDEELRREVELLIRSHEQAGSLIDSPAYERDEALIEELDHGDLDSRTLGHYRIVRRLGGGGMGEVYLAEDTQLGRRVAVKILPRRLTADASLVARFRQEARAASTLNHPNIVTIYEIGEAEGIHFIATELVEGETLREHIASKQLTVTEAIDIATQVTAALAKAHQHGVVHRDVKPENIMLDDEGHAKVLDFGIAKLTEQARGTTNEAPTVLKVETSPGAVVGTAQYMSPEQARALRDVDARTDLWSVGVVLYEMLAGRQPFEGATTTDVMSAILNKEPAPVARFNREVSEALELLVQKALTKDREERYQTARDLLSDLRRVRQRLDTGDTSVNEAPEVNTTLIRVSGSETEVEATRTNKAVQAHTTSSAEYIVTEIKRHKRGVIVTLVLLVLVGAGVAFALYKSSGSKQETVHSFQNFTASRITTTGRAHDANISPDGKYIVYLEMAEDGSRGLWVKQMATGITIPIVPPSKGNILKENTFSPDGTFVYYNFSDRVTREALYRVSSIGGTAPKKLLANCNSPITFSPDGKHIAFIRWEKSKSSLMVANADGTGERIIATRGGSEWFSGGGPSWSPDGKTIASSAGTKIGDNEEDKLLGIDVESGAVKELSQQRWSEAGRVVWLPDGNALVLVAMEHLQEARLQVWHVSHPSGKARRITNDVQGRSYSSLGVTADGRTLVTVTRQPLSRIETVPANGDIGRLVRLTTSPANEEGFRGFAFAPDGRIVFSSFEGSQSDIWIMNPDGSGRQRLTSDSYHDENPAVSPNGRYVVFRSNRATGGSVPHLWRMDIDGSNLKQLTSVFDISPDISPDGRWVIYNSWTPVEGATLWKVSIEGGDRVRLTDYIIEHQSYSPDGRWIAFIAYLNGPHNAIIPASGGVKPIREFSFPGFQYQQLRWADSQHLSFIGPPPDPSNIWLQPIEDGEARQLTNFKAEYIFRHAWSRDGKTLGLARGFVSADVVLMTDTRSP